MPETSPSKLIVVERSRTAVILGIVAALAYAIILITAFSVIIARQSTIDRLREQIDNESEAVLCRARFNIDIMFHDQAAEAAERTLVSSLIRELAVPVEERDFTAILEASDRVDILNAETEDHLQALRDYLAAGQPLPCPQDEQNGAGP